MRDAEIGDAPGIARVHVRTWQVAYAHAFTAEQLSELSVESREELWREWLEAPPPGWHAFVGIVDHEVVGFVTVGAGREEPAHVGELYAIYVLPDVWGRGVGQALMQRALSCLASESFTEAVLWVLEDNPRTRRFYELTGWSADGGIKDEEFLGTLIREVRYRIALDTLR